MAEDWGLIQGLAEGLKSGLSSYQKTQQDAEDRALKKRLARVQEIESAAKIAEAMGGVIPKGLFSEEVENIYYKKPAEEPSGLLADAEPSEGLIKSAGPGEKIPGFLTRQQRDLQKQIEFKNIDLAEKGKKARIKDGQIIIEDISTPEQKFERQQKQQKTLAEMRKAEADAKIAENKVGEVAAEVPFRKLPKEKQILVENLTKTQSTMIPIKSQLRELAAQIEDPSRSDADKLAIAQEQLKLLNSTLGADAVGAEEVKRIAAFLDPWPNWVKKMPGADLKGFLRQVQASEQRVGKTIESLKGEVNKAYGKDPGLQPQTMQGPKSMSEAEKQAALEFVAKNPNSPQAKAIKQALGIGDR